MSQNPQALTVFIAHGTDTVTKRAVVKWLKQQKQLAVRVIDFDGEAIAGDASPLTLERVASEGDAAIILATPDDVGRSASEEIDEPRARQNVWIELGWFWARLGRHRALLLVKGSVAIPRNYDGVKRIHFSESISEAKDEIYKFFASLRTSEPDHHTELVYLSSNPDVRDMQWRSLHEAATRQLVITGISMGAVRNAMPKTLAEMRIKKPHLQVTFLVVHPEFTQKYHDLFQLQHGDKAVSDNHSFFIDMLDHLETYSAVANRVRFVLYNGIPPFAVVVADGPEWGSTMLVQPFIIKPRENKFAHPRFMLKRRSNEGVYMTYWQSIEDMISKSDEEVTGLQELNQLVERIKKLGDSKRNLL